MAGMVHYILLLCLSASRFRTNVPSGIVRLGDILRNLLLPFPHYCIDAAPRKQFIVAPAFDHPAFDQYKNLVSMHDGRQTMSNEQGGDAVHQALDVLLNKTLCAAVKR